MVKLDHNRTKKIIHGITQLERQEEGKSKSQPSRPAGNIDVPSITQLIYEFCLSGSNTGNYVIGYGQTIFH